MVRVIASKKNYFMILEISKSMNLSDLRNYPRVKDFMSETDKKS